jgi:hypothetical protein
MITLSELTFSLSEASFRKQHLLKMCKPDYIIRQIALYVIPLSAPNCTLLDVEWRIGSTHGSGARGPAFDYHPDPDGFIGSLISLLSDNRLKNNFINLLYCDVKLKKNKILLFVYRTPSG